MNYIHKGMDIFFIHLSINGQVGWFCVFAYCKLWRCLFSMLSWIPSANMTKGIFEKVLSDFYGNCTVPIPNISEWGSPYPPPSQSSLAFLLCDSFYGLFIHFNGLFTSFYECEYSCKNVSKACAHLVPTESTRRHQVHRTGVTDGCELPCMCWEWNIGPLQEQQLLWDTKPSLQTLFLTVSMTGVRWNLNVFFVCIALMARNDEQFFHGCIGHLYFF